MHGINLIWPHHHQLLFAGDEHHVATDGLAEGAFDEKGFGKAVKVGDLLVVLGGELIDGQEALFCIKGEVAAVVIGEVVSFAAIAHNEKLKEAEESSGVAVAGIVLVINNLLHGPSRADAERLQLDLSNRHAIDEQNDIIAMMAVVGVDAELIDNLERVFAPILDINQGIVERCSVVAGEAVAIAQGAGGGEDIGGDDFFKQAGELAIGQADLIEGLEFFAKVLLQRSTVADVLPVLVFEAAELLNESILKQVFRCRHGDLWNEGTVKIQS